MLGLAMVTRGAPGLRAVGLICGVVGASTLPGLVIVDSYDMALAQKLPMDQAVAVEEQVNSYIGLMMIFLPTMVGLRLGMILLAVAAWRVRFAPLAATLAFVVGFVVFAVVRGGGPVSTVVGLALMTVGLLDFA